jgi:hypothetical protein
MLLSPHTDPWDEMRRSDNIVDVRRVDQNKLSPFDYAFQALPPMYHPHPEEAYTSDLAKGLGGDDLDEMARRKP